MKKLKSIDWIIILGSIIIAIGSLYIAERLSDGIIKNIFREVASLVGITGILSVILRRLDYTEILDNVLETALLSKGIKDTGLFCIFPSFRDLNFRDEICQAIESIDICVIYSSSWIKTHIAVLLEFAKKRNAKIRVCFLDPNSSATVSLDEKYRTVDEGNLPEKIQESINFVRKNFNSLQNEKIEIYLQPYIPHHSIYRFDNKVYILPYFLSPGRFEVPVFGFKRLESGAGLFTNFLADFERLIQLSEQLPLK